VKLGAYENFAKHIGNNIYATVSSPYAIIRLQQYKVNTDEGFMEIEKSIQFSKQQWESLMVHFQNLNDTMPLYSSAQRCYDTHENQILKDMLIVLSVVQGIYLQTLMRIGVMTLRF
jgi:hypothetical protein